MSNLVVPPPAHLTNAEGAPAATIMDFVPITNIPPFPMCSAPLNPTVIAATAAKSGVATPAACLPVTVPWVPGSPTVYIDNVPALSSTSTCMCLYLGVIKVTVAGTIKINVP